MPVPESAIAKYREIAAEAESACAGSRELHESWRAAYDFADARAEAARRDEHARRARERAQELARLRDACAAELRRRGVPEARLHPRIAA